MWENKRRLMPERVNGLLGIKYPCHVGDATSVFDPTQREGESNFKCVGQAS